MNWVCEGGVKVFSDWMVLVSFWYLGVCCMNDRLVCSVVLSVFVNVMWVWVLCWVVVWLMLMLMVVLSLVSGVNLMCVVFDCNGDDVRMLVFSCVCCWIC